MRQPDCAGMCFGHRKLIQLSPKKTWEGFIGGCLTTVVASWYLAGFLSRFKWMTCPRTVQTPHRCSATYFDGFIHQISCLSLTSFVKFCKVSSERTAYVLLLLVLTEWGYPGHLASSSTRADRSREASLILYLCSLARAGFICAMLTSTPVGRLVAVSAQWCGSSLTVHLDPGYTNMCMCFKCPETSYSGFLISSTARCQMIGLMHIGHHCEPLSCCRTCQCTAG